MQVIQDAVDEIEIEIVANAKWRGESSRQLSDRMLDLWGNVNVTVSPVDAIPLAPPGSSGSQY